MHSYGPRIDTMNTTPWGRITHFPAMFFLKLAPFLSPTCALAAFLARHHYLARRYFCLLRQNWPW